MQTVELTAAVDRIRNHASGFTTTFIAAPERVEEWVRRGLLTVHEIDGCLLILRRDRDFFHLHHAAASLDALDRALRTFDAGCVLAADLVGRSETLAALGELYGRHGFCLKRRLVRMVRLGTLVEQGGQKDVVFAVDADVPSIQRILEANLDRFSEQIPEAEEIRSAVAKHGILQVRGASSPAGLLFFETSGLTSLLRYWYVDRSCRGGGAGGRLMRAFLTQCAGTRRILLWVFDDNTDAIEKYGHYGFRPEGLADWIFLRGTLS